ncbi:hypothetical protein DIS24_g8030 [Lasiodiplodia hormozganensis]|uniref:Uncharacterized protein n=1 Tax=Lasiodiplodia hormozganensis TaxID=869390 RepID=A0AA39Y3Y4_9PEZI|nr:hypothetical protein DIS24_g8030 [Lasiodiplodia hormozganensis]
MHSKLTFADGVNGIYIAPLQEAVYEKFPAFFKEVLEEAEYTSNSDAVIKLSGVPQAAILALIHVLQHDALTVPPNAAQQKLTFLADALIVGDTYHLFRMALNALQLFREHLEQFPSSPSGNGAAFAADFVAAVQAAYAPDPHPHKQFTHQAMRVVRRVHVPELKRLVVEYAAERCEKMMEDEAYVMLFIDKEYAFCSDVLRAAKMMRGDGDDSGSDGGGGDVDGVLEKKEEVAGGVVDWDDFFGDDRFVTIVDCEGKQWVTTLEKASQNSKLLCVAPGPEFGSMFGHAIYELPDDHPWGIEAMIRVLEDGADNFHVPSRIEHDAGLAVEWLTNAMVVGYKYEITPMFEGVSRVLAREKYLDRCNEPHAIAEAVRAIFKLNYEVVRDEDLNELLNCIVGYFAERYESIPQIDVYKDLFEDFPEFDEGVREERLKRGLGEEDADNADDDDGADVGVEHGET